MEIGKFKLAKANLIRPPKKPTSEFLTREEAEIKSPGLFNAEVNENVVTKNYDAEEYVNRIKSYMQSKYIDEDFGRQLIEKKLKEMEMVPSDLDTSRINFSIGTQPNNILNQSEPTQLAKFLVDDLSPGPLKDELTKDYDDSQETHEEYLKRKSIPDRPFNSSLEESTIGPGGYEMTAGLSFPMNLKKAKDAIQTGKVAFKDARKIVNYFKDQMQGYQGATKIGESTKKDFIPDANFLKVFNDFKNRYFQGNVSKASKDLGFHERYPKDVEQRYFQSQTGSRTLPEEGRLLTKDFIIPEPSNGMEFSEMTTLMKRDPEKFTSLKLDKEDPNKFLDTESLGHYLGLKFDRSDKGNLIGSGKNQYDFLALQLKKLDVKKNNLGQYNVNDAITKLVEKNKTKLVKGERKSEMGAGRYDLEKKFDPELFQIRNLARDRVLKRSKGLDIYLPNAVDNAGHPYSLTKSEEKYKNLFKDSNMNKINTLVYQDPLINKELFKTSGYESKYDKMFDELSKIQNKKITPEIQKELLKIKNNLNENYNYVKNIIKSPKELSKYLPKNTDQKFINYLSKTQGDRIQKIDINIPEVGKTFKSKDVFVDMSSVNPKYILGYVNNINPNAKKFKDLSLSEKELYKNNLLLQNAEIVSEFYRKAKFPEEDVEAVKETVGMEFAQGGRAGFNEGKLAKVGKVAGKTFAGIDAPFTQALFGLGYTAGEDPLFYTIPAALTETVNKYLNLYEKSPSKAKNFLKSTLRLMPIEQAQKFYPIFSKVGKIGSTTGYPFLKAASEGLKEIKVRGETERAAADFKMSPQKMKDLRSKSIVANLPEIKDDTYVPTEQDYSEANEKIQKARDAFALQAKILGSIVGLTEDPLAEKESIYTRGQQVPMSLERVQEGRAEYRYGGDTMGGINDKSVSSPGPDQSKVSDRQERNNQRAVAEAQMVNKINEARAKQSPFKTYLDHSLFTKGLKRVGSIPNYHQLGGYDFMSRFPNTPPSIAKGLGYAYQGLSEGIRSLNPFDNYSFQDAMTKAGEEGRLNALGVDAYGNPTNSITQQYYNLPIDLQPNFATGGRVGFADGPKPSKRNFLKMLSLIPAGIMAIRGGPNLLKKAKQVVPAAEKVASEAEKIFFNLVDAVKNKGILKKLDEMTDYRQGGAYHEYKGAEVLEDGGSITARFKTDTGAPAEIVYIKPQKRIDPKTGKEVEYPGEFDYEAQEVGRMNPEGDVDIDAEFEIMDSLEDVKKLIND